MKRRIIAVLSLVLILTSVLAMPVSAEDDSAPVAASVTPRYVNISLFTASYDDTYCYLDPNNNGAMVTGWKTISGKTYYFDEDGLMQTSWQEIDGNWYYFADSGAMQTGWCKPASIWFYLDPTTGIMQTGWLYLEDGTYYLSRNESTLGYMLTGWVKISGSWHYFNSSGRMQTGWLDYQDERYYLDPNNNGAALTGTHIIDGVEYTFDEDGALIS